MASIGDRQPRPTRRQLLTAGAVAAGGSLLGAGRARAQSDQFDGWFDDVSNYDGVVDATGQSEVTVDVGVDNGGQPYGFGPAAVRIDPGATVVWKWTGNGNSHNVVAEDGSFESELSAEEGHTFSHTFESEGTFKYACTPHKSLGMKGAIVVGGSGGEVAEPDYDGWFDGVENYDSTVDRRGQSEVTVDVGVDNGGDPYGFGPPAVRIDPGATVVWEWTGRGSSHNVVAEDGSFESDLAAEEGHTFSHTFEEKGVYRYVCTPHRSLGMKGAIVVGDVGGGGGGGGGGSGGGGEGEEAAGGGFSIPMPSDFVGWLAVVVGGSGALAVGSVLAAESYSAYREHDQAEEAYVGEQATDAVEPAPEVEIGEGYDPTGTATLVAGYFLLIALLWVFMYFVEFLGGPTITG
ncbi:halocyanin domain-containing protein [Halolamina salifodinae]|uniref:Halocyanin-like protein n=1 Tax=Halolamina salifodinae TaxID=1202767 RepID=A0A8T4GXX8_9EURY|nr:halocyanin domain-containing protein [Halolamina salifodinae]MBP1987052.1 halocyanin-like protein [Halolamina salifodinae]